MYRPLANQQNFTISVLNKNSESSVNLELLLWIQNSVSEEALRVFVIIRLLQIFFLMHGHCNELP